MNQTPLDMARIAFKLVSDHKDDEEFAKHTKKLPVRIVGSGLIQSLAFMKGKSNNWKPPKYAPALCISVMEQVQLRMGKKFSEPADWIKLTPEELRIATQTALDYLLWVKRFAESEIVEKKS